MKTICRLGFSLLLASGAALRGAEAVAEPDLTSLIVIIEQGKFEHALRAIEHGLVNYPDNARLLRFKAVVLESYGREWGARANGARPRSLVATVAPPPMPPGGRAAAGRDFTAESASVPMVWIAPGTFMMSEVNGSDDDTLVTHSRGFWLGRTELTQEQWRTMWEENADPSLFRGSDRPVERVTWLDAMEFGRRLTERERVAGRLPDGYEYILPTEAQWEYACRAGTTKNRVQNLDEVAWYDANSGGETHPVAQKRPNAWGLYDMHGNVWEWCRDGMAGYPGGKATDPLQADPSGGSHRISRGGGFNASAGSCRPNIRHWRLPTNAVGAGGFRIALVPVRDLPAPKVAADRK